MPRQSVSPLPPPDQMVVSESDVLRLVTAHPGISLKDLCAELWPQLPWYPSRPSELSATQAPGATAPAELVRVAMATLVRAGHVVKVPRPDEVDELAQQGWSLPGARLGQAPPRISTDGRRQPRVRGTR